MEISKRVHSVSGNQQLTRDICDRKWRNPMTTYRKIFANSNFGKALLQAQVLLPAPNLMLCASELGNVLYFLVGERSFPAKNLPHETIASARFDKRNRVSSTTVFQGHVGLSKMHSAFLQCVGKLFAERVI